MTWALSTEVASTTTMKSKRQLLRRLVHTVFCKACSTACELLRLKCDGMLTLLVLLLCCGVLGCCLSHLNADAFWAAGMCMLNFEFGKADFCGLQQQGIAVSQSISTANCVLLRKRPDSVTVSRQLKR